MHAHVLRAMPHIRELTEHSRTDRTTIVFPGGTVVAEVATTDAARRQGLAGRASLAPGSGMLFRFAKPDYHAFHTLGMQFGIDLVYLVDAVVTGVLTVMPEAEPFEGFVADAVLEVAAGWAAEHGVRAGQRVVFQ